MKPHGLTPLRDHVLLLEPHTLVTRERATTAALLAHIAEVDKRRLYLGAGYPSMFLFCVHELHMSEDMALERIQAARAARQFPAIFAAVEDGRLNLSGVLLLAPYMAPDTADALLAAAAQKTDAEIELLLAERFPSPDVPTVVQAVAPAAALDEHAPGQVGALNIQLSPGTVVPTDQPNVAMGMEPLVPLAACRPRRHKPGLTPPGHEMSR